MPGDQERGSQDPLWGKLTTCFGSIPQTRPQQATYESDRPKTKVGDPDQVRKKDAKPCSQRNPLPK